MSHKAYTRQHLVKLVKRSNRRRVKHNFKALMSLGDVNNLEEYFDNPEETLVLRWHLNQSDGDYEDIEQ
jgi:hypothetical protein